MELLLFPHSHYCEMARWALDHKAVDYQVRAILPGLHLLTTRNYGPDRVVPILLTEEQAIQGSSEIVDFLEKSIDGASLTPTNEAERTACLALECSFNQELGRPLRQILYSELLDYSDFIIHCFTLSMAAPKRVLLKALFPILKNKIHAKFVRSPAKVLKARKNFDQAITNLATRLDGKDYLVGDRFTRADLAAASMLSLLALPDEHPFPWEAMPDSARNGLYAEYANHSVLEWVRTIYRKHRS